MNRSGSWWARPRATCPPARSSSIGWAIGSPRTPRREYGREVEGHFGIQRIEPGRLWLEPILSGEREIGPIPVPERVTRACKVGWDVGGVVGESAQGWRLVEVWNISP